MEKRKISMGEFKSNQRTNDFVWAQWLATKNISLRSHLVYFFESFDDIEVCDLRASNLEQEMIERAIKYRDESILQDEFKYDYHVRFLNNLIFDHAESGSAVQKEAVLFSLNRVSIMLEKKAYAPHLYGSATWSEYEAKIVLEELDQMIGKQIGWEKAKEVISGHLQKLSHVPSRDLQFLQANN